MLFVQARARVLEVEALQESKEQRRDLEEAQNAKRMWLLAVIATYAHLFGTILPLVVENFVVGQDQTFSSIMEGLIGFSVPVTMVLYTEWCTMYQTKVAVFAETPDY